MKELLSLFVSFIRIGLFTFGGGYAMLPMLQKEVCEKRKWAAENEIMDYYAVGQCTPGVIAVNVATFVGYKRRGVAGAIFATAGMIFPSLIIITIIAALIKNFAEIEAVKHAFSGIRVAVFALLLNVIIRFYKTGVTDLFGIALFLTTLFLALFLDISPFILVIGAALSGILYKKFRRAKK